MATVYSNPAELLDHVGDELGHTDWLAIDQARIDTFADATGDHQWIHVDPDAAASGPFGTTIAHGYLTLSITNLFLPQLIEVQNVSMGLNYGANKVRFPTPVPVGSRIRGKGTITDAVEVDGGVQVVITLVVEVEGGAKPACVVESVSRYLV
jgi:acyl dehydratase